MNQYAKNFYRPELDEMKNRFSMLTKNHHALQAWKDFVVLGACNISPLKQSEYSPEFINLTGRYTTDELMIMMEMLEITTAALSTYPEYDFLGEFYTYIDSTNRSYRNKRSPSLYTKTSVSVNYLREELVNSAWLKITDEACGTGSVIIQILNDCRSEHLNYQSTLFFVAKDHNRSAALACYLQLSLLGCAGCVIAPDGLGLHSPVDNLGTDAHEGYEIWIMPMTYTGDWQWRFMVDQSCKTLKLKK